MATASEANVPPVEVPVAVSDGTTFAALPADADPDIVRLCIVESLEHIAAAEAALLALEADPHDSERINEVFRAFHTIKGSAGLLGLDPIQKLAHRSEDLLSLARKGEISLTGRLADLALETCDVLKIMMETLDGTEPGSPFPIPPSYGDLVERLTDPVPADGAEVQPPARH